MLPLVLWASLIVAVIGSKEPPKNQCVGNVTNCQNTALDHQILQDRLKQLREDGLKTHRAYDSPLSEMDNAQLARHIAEITAYLDRQKRNPFKRGSEDEDLREKEVGDEDDDILEEGFVFERPNSQRRRGETLIDIEDEDTEDIQKRPKGFEGRKEDYCDKYEQNYAYFCVGDTDTDNIDLEQVEKFCPSYHSACPKKRITATPSKVISSRPQSPFSNDEFSIASHSHHKKHDSSEELFEKSEQEVYYDELKRRFPCKPDCDRRIFPHCTAECKCDYMYPMVQRFCNPPPMPMFLNTCRLWYHGCPKYQNYHYSSQFVYSKAEKGKVLPGSVKKTTNNFGFAHPARGTRNHQQRSLHLRPIARGSKTQKKEFLVIPPALPKKTQNKSATSHRTVSTAARHHNIKSEHRSTRVQRKHKRAHQNERRRQRAAATKEKNKETWRLLKSLNGLTSTPTRHTKDPAAFHVGRHTHGNSKKPRAEQVRNFPVVASDAAWGADPAGARFTGGRDTFRTFDGYTDTRGVLHRPRSSSPFTKPGLWEPNPDDPHSRDPANKYYYHPESVGVDWLNGQLQWGAHWAVPAAGVGGTDGFSAVHFPTIGTFLNVPDDYD